MKKEEVSVAETIEDVLRSLIKEHGKKLYKKENVAKLKAFLSDFTVKFPKERDILNVVIEEGVQEKLLVIDNGSNDEKYHVALSCRLYLINELGFAENCATEVVNILASGLGWEMPLLGLFSEQSELKQTLSQNSIGQVKDGNDTEQDDLTQEDLNRSFIMWALYPTIMREQQFLLSSSMSAAFKRDKHKALLYAEGSKKLLEKAYFLYEQREPAKEQERIFWENYTNDHPITSKDLHDVGMMFSGSIAPMRSPDEILKDLQQEIAKSQAIQSLDVILKRIVFEYGIDIYKKENSQRLKAILADIVMGKQNLKTLNIAIQNGIPEILLSYNNMNIDEQQSCITRCVEKLEENYGINKEKAIETINYLTEGLGWKERVSLKNQEDKGVEKKKEHKRNMQTKRDEELPALENNQQRVQNTIQNITTNITDFNGISIKAPVAGKVLRYGVKEGSFVKENTTVIIMESFMMEVEVKAKSKGTIHFLVSPNTNVSNATILAEVYSDTFQQEQKQYSQPKQQTISSNFFEKGINVIKNSFYIGAAVLIIAICVFVEIGDKKKEKRKQSTKSQQTVQNEKQSSSSENKNNSAVSQKEKITSLEALPNEIFGVKKYVHSYGLNAHSEPELKPESTIFTMKKDSLVFLSNKDKKGISARIKNAKGQIGWVNETYLRDFKITSIEIGNYDDYGMYINKPGHTLYASKIRRLGMNVYADTTDNSPKEVTFFIKIEKSDGSSRIWDDVISTEKHVFACRWIGKIKSGTNEIITNFRMKPNYYADRPGTWKLEIWCYDFRNTDDEGFICIASKSFELN